MTDSANDDLKWSYPEFLDVAKLLLGAGASVAAVNKSGQSPIRCLDALPTGIRTDEVLALFKKRL
jgi:hypothetical protein